LSFWPASNASFHFPVILWVQLCFISLRAPAMAQSSSSGRITSRRRRAKPLLIRPTPNPLPSHFGASRRPSGRAIETRERPFCTPPSRACRLPCSLHWRVILHLPFPSKVLRSVLLRGPSHVFSRPQVFLPRVERRVESQGNPKQTQPTRERGPTLHTPTLGQTPFTAVHPIMWKCGGETRIQGGDVRPLSFFTLPVHIRSRTSFPDTVSPRGGARATD